MSENTYAMMPYEDYAAACDAVREQTGTDEIIKSGDMAAMIMSIENSAGEKGNGIKSAVLNADYTLTLTFDDGTEYTTPSIRGAQGPAGKDGAPGLDGAPGADGYTPVYGVDYMTPKDKAEIEAFIATELAKRGQLKPEFANSIEECTDTTKLYVLPDGYIYGYIYTEKVISCNNLAEPLPNNTTDTSKWVNGYRISSSGISAQSGKTLSNPISCQKGDVIRIKGVTFVNSVDRYGSWDSNGANYGNGTGYVSAGSTSFIGINIVNDVYEFTVLDNQPATMRFAFTTPTDPSGIVITKNEEIVENQIVNEYAWTNTGHAFIPADYEDRIVELEEKNAENAVIISTNTNEIATIDERVEALENGAIKNNIPDYWTEYLDNKIETIKELHNQGGRDCFSFIFMTDTHYPSNLGKCSPLLSKKIMDECNIKHVVHGGDAQTRGCHNTKEALLEENKNIEEMFSPIRDRMLFVEGNHDGAYATVNGVTYAKQLNDAEMYEEYFRRVGFVDNIHFCDEANAYYVDDVANKVRYICLDTHCVPDTTNDDGTAVYNKFRSLSFTQAQFDFLTGEALVNGMTDKWNVIVIGHVYINERQNDFGIMMDLLSAYQSKTKCSETYTGENDFNTVSVDADFTTAKGTLVGYFCGHKHVDAAYKASDVNVIITRCDAKEENDSTLNAERVKGTITEQSFDVFTVNKATRKIYATKIGAGDDREISY